MYARIGEIFEHTEIMDEETISEFAHLIGDLNPLHHDRPAAEASRFGGIIASGPHCASILLAQAANYFSERTSMVGLEFSLKFKGPARPGDVLLFRWEVMDVVWNEKLGGDIVSLAGYVSDSTGTEILTSQGKILVSESL
ncbi:MAG: MaoC family dehydratase [Deltaproteobacteria bacterium]|jgi:acyl dehydratase|nr:MaoC family dehydratase [Deltaproteobacteria bacterium]